MIEIAIKIESLANLREHWTVRANRARSHREIVGWSLKTTLKPLLPVTVKLTRVGPRVWDDDNNIGGCKNARDAIAAWLGVDDSDKRIRWIYDQETGSGMRPALRIEFL